MILKKKKKNKLVSVGISFKNLLKWSPTCYSNEDHLVSHLAHVNATLRNSKGTVGRDLSWISNSLLIGNSEGKIEIKKICK